MGLPAGQSTGLDFTSFSNALKIIYSKQAVVDETYKNRPFHAMISKDTDFTGSSFVQDVITSLPQGRARVFGQAQANKSGLQVDQFTILRAYDFALASVDMWTMLASQDDRGAMLNAMTSAINGARGSLMRSAAIAEFRDGTGQIGSVAAVVTGALGTITLNSALDITNFERNQALNAYSATNFFVIGTLATRHVTGGNTVTAPDGSTSAGVMIVQKVDRVNFILTLDNVPTNVVAGAVGTGDYLVGDSDYGKSTVGAVSAWGKISGLAGWLPYGGPAVGDSFFGLDRTADPVRLAGWSSNQIGKSEDEALLNASMEIFLYGTGNTSHAFVAPTRFNNLVKLAGPQRRITEVKAKNSSIGFNQLEVYGQGGTIKVFADPNCPDARGYLLQFEDWKLKTLGAMPRFLNPNDKSLVEATQNRLEIRTGYAGNIYCKAPGRSGVVAFA